MNQKTRKLMTMYKALHPSDDVDRLYVTGKGGRGLANIKNSVDALIQWFEDYVQKRGERLITATRKNTDNTRSNGTTITNKEQLYGRFKRLTSDISHEKTLKWLRKGNLKRETESLLITAQNNAIKTNHIKVRIGKTQQNSRCSVVIETKQSIT